MRLELGTEKHSHLLEYTSIRTSVRLHREIRLQLRRHKKHNASTMLLPLKHARRKCALIQQMFIIALPVRHCGHPSSVEPKTVNNSDNDVMIITSKTNHLTQDITQDMCKLPTILLDDAVTNLHARIIIIESSGETSAVLAQPSQPRRRKQRD